MNKSDLIKQVAAKAGVTKEEAAVYVDTVLDAISNSLYAHEKVQLLGFGTFEVRCTATRTVRNPHTGKKVVIPQKSRPVFRPGKMLKDAANP